MQETHVQAPAETCEQSRNPDDSDTKVSISPHKVAPHHMVEALDQVLQLWPPPGWRHDSKLQEKYAPAVYQVHDSILYPDAFTYPPALTRLLITCYAHPMWTAATSEAKQHLQVKALSMFSYLPHRPFICVIACRMLSS